MRTMIELSAHHLQELHHELHHQDCVILHGYFTSSIINDTNHYRRSPHASLCWNILERASSSRKRSRDSDSDGGEDGGILLSGCSNCPRSICHRSRLLNMKTLLPFDLAKHVDLPLPLHDLAIANSAFPSLHQRVLLIDIFGLSRNPFGARITTFEPSWS